MLDPLPRAGTDRWLGLAVTAGTFCLLLGTLHQPLITWDEGYTIRREERMRDWFELLISPPDGVSRAQLFGERAIETFWPFAREEPDGHPPFYAVIGNIGWWLGHTWLPPAEVHRLGPAALFSVTCGVMYVFLARRWGRLAGFAAAGAWLLMPRVFAHAHLASYDAPLACLWFLTVVAFWKAREGWLDSFPRGLGWSVVFSISLAFCAVTKFTGWLIPLPLFVWSVGAACRSVCREGFASLPKLALAAVCLAPLIGAIPAELLLLRSVTDIEAGLPPQAGENSQIRARRAADAFRSTDSAHSFNFLLFGAAAIWCIVYGSKAILRLKQPTAAGEPGKRRAVGTDDELALDAAQSIVPPPKPISASAETWAAAALTPAITVALVPNWWHDPLRGIAIFLWSNLTRQKTTWIPTQFFGTLYEFSLPWYNTLAWVALTVPPPILLLFILGVAATPFAWYGRGRPNARLDSLAWLFLANAATLLVIRALPGSPGHDSERQMIGSFPFIACMTGLGAQWLWGLVARITTPFLGSCVASGMVCISLIWSAAAIWHYRTAPLGYYTEAIGGLRGAARLGLEPTYYWDSLNGEAVDWLNANTRPGERVQFCNFGDRYDSLGYLYQWGILRVEVLPLSPGVTRWYVLQNRPGLFLWNPTDRWLAKNGQPAYTRALDGVPLIWIYPFDLYERAHQETRREAR